MKYSLRRQNKGFSLIEVAIAVVIIGLIASFTLKGRELIRTAKLRSVIEQVNSIRVASQAFVEKYGGMPGDFPSAKEMINDDLENGRGDGVISSIGDSDRFWSHLAAADIIHLEVVKGRPLSKNGGFFSVSTSVPGHSGIWLVLSGGTSDNKSFSAALSQEDAHFIDKNSDTGNPSTGEVRTLAASGLASIGQKYDLKNKNKDCVIIFRLS
ncbi:MAG: prepilin-type N-terminal cleavage/methylation domain-containing protein [Holosporaceae bacterium]|jgi:prepilin-type N-terminal cleavage/methylation domain-containing protein|nr:prepilin-type N-terminal cleavage/methylation domain-containing protein [Holosporaceae bacterium]